MIYFIFNGGRFLVLIYLFLSTCGGESVGPTGRDRNGGV